MSVTVERGYNFQITDTAIKLDTGATVATWSGAEQI